MQDRSLLHRQAASMAETGGGKFPLVFVFMGEYTDELHHRLKEFIMPQMKRVS